MVFAISCLSSQIWAQNDQKKPEELVTYGEQGKTNTATKLDLTLFETPQTVTAISRTQLDDFALTTINDVLNYAPGITVEEVETDRNYYTARGIDIVNFQYDGVGIPFISGLSFGQQDTALYEKIEIVKGAAGLITGLANPSATINYIRKRPTKELQASVALSLDEWSGRRLDGDVSGSINSNIRGRAVLAYDKGESYLDRHEDETKLAYGIVEFDLSDATLLTLGHSFDNSHSTGVLWGALPLKYSDGTPTNYDVSTSNAPDWTFADSKQSQTFAELTQEIGNNWALNLILTQNKTRYEAEWLYVYGTPDADTELGLTGQGSAYDREENQDNVDAYISGTFSFGGRQHDLVFGYSNSDTEIKDASRSDPAGNPILSGDWAQGNTPAMSFTSFNPDTSTSNIDLTQRAFYVASRLNILDNLSVLLGARNTKLEQSGISFGGDVQADADETVPYYGITYEIVNDLMLYGSYTEVFKQQTWVNVALQPLGPTMGKSQEAGLKKSFNDERSVLTLAVFSSTQNNYGSFTERNSDGVAIYEGVTLDSKGYEIEFSGELFEGLNIGAGYTNVDLENEKGNDIRQFIPSKILKLSSTYSIPQIDGLKIGGVIKWQDDITTETQPNQTPHATQSAYTLVDLALHYQLQKNLGVSLNIENITDQKYLNSLYWDQAFYGAPRNVSASVRWTY